MALDTTGLDIGETSETKKEEFNLKLSDEELIQQITAWERESEELYGLLERVTKENLNYYHGNQTDVELIRGKQSKAVENRIFMAVETMIPIATARLPEIEAVSNDDNEKAQINAQRLQKVINYQLEKLNVQELTEQFARDMITKRLGVFKTPWDKKFDDVDLKLIDPKRIRIPKFGRSVDELAFLIEELELSYGQLKDFFGEAKAKDVLASSPKDADHKVRKVTYLVQEVWTNEYVCWRSGNIILKKEANPYYDQEDVSKNHFDHPRKPYIIKSLFQTDESIIGDTDYIQQIKRIQDNVNIRKRQIEDITNQVANPNLLIDSQVMSEEEAALITNEPGQIIYGPNVANEAMFRYQSPGQVPAYLFSDLEFSRQEFDNIWGLHSTTRGEREGRETLGGRKLLRQADLGRIDLVARQIERALGEVADWFTQLIKLFYTEQRFFAIVGDEGTEMIRGFSGEEVSNVKLTVRPGSTLPRDEVTIHGEALQLWQLGAIGVRTLYKMLKLPNVGEAIKDFAETKSGAILQQGGGQGAIPQLPGGQQPEGLQRSPQEQITG